MLQVYPTTAKPRSSAIAPFPALESAERPPSGPLAAGVVSIPTQRGFGACELHRVTRLESRKYIMPPILQAASTTGVMQEPLEALSGSDGRARAARFPSAPLSTARFARITSEKERASPTGDLRVHN